jgi:siroheme synthase (precorrin-2 oxidase/ferrochelatase)
MTDKQHTPGPWRVGTPPPNGEQTIGTFEGLMVAVATTGASGISAKANARRIVACVNACEGIRTEALEHRAHLLKAEDDTIAKLQQQRDELLAAMNRILEGPKNTMSDGKALKEIIGTARAAIAKVEAK